MVAVMLGVVNKFPVANKFPAESYHCMFPSEAVAIKVRVPESHREFAVVEITVGIVFMEAITAVLFEMQPAST